MSRADLMDLNRGGKFEVCSRCRGHGKHVNPAVDGHGISREEFAEDPDFEEDYRNGVYDVPCEKCNGERVVLVADLEACDAAQKRAYADHCFNEAEARREREHEIRMGY